MYNSNYNGIQAALVHTTPLWGLQAPASSRQAQHHASMHGLVSEGQAGFSTISPPDLLSWAGHNQGK